MEEGKAQRASDIDIVWINGYGWPVYRGGPTFYADSSAPTSARQIQGVRGDDGRDFKPAPLLESAAAKKRRFQDLIRPG